MYVHQDLQFLVRIICKLVFASYTGICLKLTLIGFVFQLNVNVNDEVV